MYTIHTIAIFIMIIFLSSTYCTASSSESSSSLDRLHSSSSGNTPPSSPQSPQSCPDGYSLLCAQDNTQCTVTEDETVAFGVEFQDIFTFQGVAAGSTSFCNQDRFGLPYGDDGVASMVCCVQQPQLLNPGLPTVGGVPGVVVGEIQIGDVRRGYTEQGAFSHFYRFEIFASTVPSLTLRFSLCNSGSFVGSLDTWIRIIRENGMVIGSNDDGSCSSDGLLSELDVVFALPAAVGVYYVEVYIWQFGFGINPNDIYTLEMTNVSPVQSSSSGSEDSEESEHEDAVYVQERTTPDLDGSNSVQPSINDVEDDEEEEENMEIASSSLCECKQDELKKILENSFYLMQEKSSGRYYIKSYLE